MGHSFVSTHFLLFNDPLILERFKRRRDIILDTDGCRIARYNGILVSVHVGVKA